MLNVNTLVWPIESVPAKGGSVIVGAVGVVGDVELSAVCVLHPAKTTAVTKTSGRRYFIRSAWRGSTAAAIRKLYEKSVALSTWPDNAVLSRRRFRPAGGGWG